MDIMTEHGPRRISGPVTCPRAAPACVKGFLDYINHTNTCIDSYNRMLLKAQEHRRLLDTPIAIMIEKPEWVLRATDRVS